MARGKKSEISGPAIKDEMEMYKLPDKKNGVSPKEAKKRLKVLLRNIEELLICQSDYMHENNQTTECMLEFLIVFPKLFAQEYGEVARDMLKWSLNENIIMNRQLIDKIQEIEDTLNLEVIHKY